MGADFTTITAEQPRIYVACLAAYNSGYLHGAWIDAVQEPWSIWDSITRMLAASPIAGAEEWAIHDHEGFGGARIAEYECIERVAGIAAFLVEHGALGAAVLDHCDSDLDEAVEAIADRYLGIYESLADYVRDLTEETTSIPEGLRFYIDWEAMARDAEIGGHLFGLADGEGNLHIFSGC